MSKALTNFNEKEVGEKLTQREVNMYSKWLGVTIEQIEKRRNNTLLTHTTLRNCAGIFLQRSKLQVQYEVPYSRGGFNFNQVRFDIIASKKKETFIIEIKDKLTERDVGQLIGYAQTLSQEKESALILGIDILSFGRLFTEPLEQIVKELMKNKNLRIMLIDKYTIIIANNYEQLEGTEKPEIYFFEDALS